VPKGVVLKRDSSDCIFQSNPTNHPDRYKCPIQRTLASSDPGGHDNDFVVFSGADDGCIITVQPVTWAWGGTSFIFQSDSNLDEINACFAPNALLSEIHAPFAPTMSPTQSRSPSISPTLSFQPTIYRAVPKGVVLKRDSSDCIFQSNPTNHPDRYKCPIQRTLASSDPGGHDNDFVVFSGADDGCIITVQPVTWAWGGTSFIFQSDSNLDEINACFAPNALLSEIHAPFAPTMSPLTALLDGPSMQPTSIPSTDLSPAPSHTLSTQPSMKQISIPSGVTLLRDDSPCVSQVNPSNHPDRFKCLIEPTQFSSDPGGHGNALTRVWGADNCSLDIRPTTWAWAGNMFIFESLDSLDVINACFGPNTLITNTPIPNGVVLKRDSSDCISQVNPSNHPDRFKCFLEQTAASSLPGGYENNAVPLVGFEGCVIYVRPVTWSWEGNGFIFESSASLAAIKDCFVGGQHITVADAGAVQPNVFE